MRNALRRSEFDKRAFIFGDKHDRAVATCRIATGWSAPA
jgi:hypothetical protein